MGRRSGYYALIQFSPQPERLEFVNIGVALMLPEERHLDIRFSENAKRVEKLFGKLERTVFQTYKEAFEARLRLEFSENSSIDHISRFAGRRANQMRMTPPMAVAVEHPAEALAHLFADLVGEVPERHRDSKAVTKLRGIFKKAGVVGFLDRPAPVVLPDVDITIKVPFAYQNGSYNMIDAIRLAGDRGDALKEAGKRAFEGQWLHDFSRAEGHPRRLVVVGDFADQPDGFYQRVRDIMSGHGVPLHRMDDPRSLLQDIERYAVPS